MKPNACWKEPDSMASNVRACPICDKPENALWRPFCSEGCKSIDLNRWLKGVYTIPVVEMDDDLSGEE